MIPGDALEFAVELQNATDDVVTIFPLHVLPPFPGELDQILARLAGSLWGGFGGLGLMIHTRSRALRPTRPDNMITEELIHKSQKNQT